MKEKKKKSRFFKLIEKLVFSFLKWTKLKRTTIEIEKEIFLLKNIRIGVKHLHTAKYMI